MNDIQARPLSGYSSQTYQPQSSKVNVAGATAAAKPAEEKPAVFISFVTDLMEAHRYVQNRRTAVGS